ncbi:MAG: hypothetical protein DMD58_09460 [Gemmatimonadetes bacterium]|nr:MAG: hypothetical protein DMD58_09460 [Gemmatimonadota bacterium]
MRRIGMAVLGLTVVTSPLMAQRSALREVHRGGNGSFGAALVVAEPLGEFSRNGDVAAGLSIFGVTSGGLLALRVEGAWMAYDVSYQGYGVSTTSQIGTLGAGPQVTLGNGALRFYGFATMGGSLFWSNASYNSCGCSASDWLDGHTTWMRSAGGGVLLGITAGHTPIAIDIGARGVRHDRVTYVPAGGLTQNSDGSFTAQQVTTPVDMRVYQVGVSIGIR